MSFSYFEKIYTKYDIIDSHTWYQQNFTINIDIIPSEICYMCRWNMC